MGRCQRIIVYICTILTTLMPVFASDRPSQPVLTPPQSSYTLREDVDSLSKITCDSNCSSPCNYTWLRDGKAIQAGKILRKINNIKRSEAGQYVCRATNEHGSRDSALRVDVLYGPSTPLFTPAQSSYSLRENVDSLTEITCNSDCNPPCNYTWLRDGRTIKEGKVLEKIKSIQRSQAGEYVCRAKNEDGAQESRLTVIVLYRPDRPVLSIIGDNGVVRESSPISLQCSTQSNPTSKITFFGENMTILKTDYNTLSSTFTIPQANCLDTRLFLCSAENINGKATSIGKNISILCKPRPDSTILSQLNQTLEVGDDLDIVSTIISNPLPSIYWVTRTNGSSLTFDLVNNTDNIQQNYGDIPLITSRVSKSTLKISDFGEYIMHAYNGYGHSIVVFTVTRKGQAGITSETTASNGNDMFTAGIAVLVVGLVAIVAAIALVVFAYCRKSRSTQTPEIEISQPQANKTYQLQDFNKRTSDRRIK